MTSKELLNINLKSMYREGSGVDPNTHKPKHAEKGSIGQNTFEPEADLRVVELAEPVVPKYVAEAETPKSKIDWKATRRDLSKARDSLASVTRLLGPSAQNEISPALAKHIRVELAKVAIPEFSEAGDEIILTHPFEDMVGEGELDFSQLSEAVQRYLEDVAEDLQLADDILAGKPSILPNVRQRQHRGKQNRQINFRQPAEQVTAQLKTTARPLDTKSLAGLGEAGPLTRLVRKFQTWRKGDKNDSAQI